MLGRLRSDPGGRSVRVQKRFLTKFGLIGAAVALVLLTASCTVISAGDAFERHLVRSGFDLAQVGYQRSEFFLSGVAASYAPTAPLTSDGKWNVAAQPLGADGAYKTRMVVYPAD